MIEKIMHGKILISLIIRAEYKSEGIEFFSPTNFSQQLAYMNRKKDYIIYPHVHNFVFRDIKNTQEVLFIKSGKVRVDYFDNEKKYLESKILNKGDVVLLAEGGHGFKIIDDAEIIEVKQGPYVGENDKTRFDMIDDNLLKIQ